MNSKYSPLPQKKKYISYLSPSYGHSLFDTSCFFVLLSRLKVLLESGDKYMGVYSSYLDMILILVAMRG